MEQPSGRKLTDLPSEMALYLCEFLEDDSLLCIVLAVPQWNWILTSAWFDKHINRRIRKWTWIDRHTYECLFPQPTAETFKGPIGALTHRADGDEYFTKQLSTCHRHLLNNACARILRTNLLSPGMRELLVDYPNRLGGLEESPLGNHP